MTNRGLSGPTRTHNTGLMINSMKPDWHLLVNLHNYFFFSLVPNDLVLGETRVKLRNPCQLNFRGKVTELRRFIVIILCILGHAPCAWPSTSTSFQFIGFRP